MKRILDCQGSDFRNISRNELICAIASAEGRTIACETIGSIIPMLGDITNAEFAAAMGADILLLNMFDEKVICKKRQSSVEDCRFSVLRTHCRCTFPPVGLDCIVESPPSSRRQAAVHRTGMRFIKDVFYIFGKYIFFAHCFGSLVSQAAVICAYSAITQKSSMWSE